MIYVTVEASDTMQLDLVVNKQIQEGFEPLGGVGVARWEEKDTLNGNTESGFIFVQAMIKREGQA